MQLFETPSGAGGKFTVKIIDQQHEGMLIGVQVHMPRNPDWHGHKFVTSRDRLTPVKVCGSCGSTDFYVEPGGYLGSDRERQAPTCSRCGNRYQHPVDTLKQDLGAALKPEVL